MRRFYQCRQCGNLVEILVEGNQPVCCEEMMELVTPNTVDAAFEKHVPVIEYTDEGVTVKVGSEPHPMEEAHYIMWIEVEYDSRRERKYLKPGETPEASFRVAAKDVRALAYCNLHGLWISN